MKEVQGQFRVKGRRLRNGLTQVRFKSAGIDPEVARWLQEQFERPQLTLLSRFPGLAKDGPQKSLLQELQDRGYDLSTLEFQISLHSAGHWKPKQLRSPSPQAGRLYARWGRLPYDSTGDLTTAWGRPARSCDSHLLHGWLSMFLVEDHRGALLGHQSTQLLEEFKRLGFDVRTLKFSVRMAKEESGATANEGEGSPSAP